MSIQIFSAALKFYAETVEISSVFSVVAGIVHGVTATLIARGIFTLRSVSSAKSIPSRRFMEPPTAFFDKNKKNVYAV